MASWCSSSCSVTSITCRCSVQCHSFQLHNRPLLHLNALPLTSSSRVAPIRIKLPFHRNNSFKHRNSSGCRRIIVCCTSSDTEMDLKDSLRSPSDIDCVGTGQDVECLIEPDEENGKSVEVESLGISIEGLLEWAVLVSPFFFWGTAMVAMKEVIPKSGPFFVSAFRLVPAGFLLVAFAASRGRPLPSGFNAWLSISLFAVVDAACFQGFLAEGLQRTSAGLGSVIIDSQPLTVAVLAALLFGESIGIVGAAGLLLGVIGLVLLEGAGCITKYFGVDALKKIFQGAGCTTKYFGVDALKKILQDAGCTLTQDIFLPALSFDESNFSLWGSGEWWMLLAAQSMAVGTVMVRWVSKYSDPVMATGWHMVIGGLPLLAISILNNDPAISGSFKEFSSTDILALLYTSIFGSAVSYGVFFYSATKGSLTKLSSLTFLTPMFASIFGFLYLGETFSPLQLVGAVVTLAAIYMVNYRNTSK